MGHAASRAKGRATSRIDHCTIVPLLDRRAGGPPTLIHMDGHRDPAPWSLQQESLHDWGPDPYIPLDRTTWIVTSACTC